MNKEYTDRKLLEERELGQLGIVKGLVIKNFQHT